MAATVIKRDTKPNRRARRAGGKATRGRFLFRKGAKHIERTDRLDARVDEAVAAWEKRKGGDK